MVNIVRVGINEKGKISLHDLLTYARSNPDIEQGGAIVTFTGIMRGYTHSGEKIQKLEIESHIKEAKRALTKISNEIRARPGVIDVLIHHFIGEFEVGEDLVYVVVVGKSRKDAFQALEVVERYKKEAAIWKKEYLEDGKSYWISE